MPFDTKLPELGFIPGPSSVGASAGASNAESLAGLAAAGAKMYKAHEQAKAAEDTSKVMTSFEADLLDAAPDQGAPTANGDPTLNADDHKILAAAKGEGARLDALEAAGHSASVLTQRREEIYRRYVTQYPHLAAELRAFFKKQTGKGVLQSVIDDQKQQAEDAHKKFSATVGFYTTFLQQNNMWKAGMSLADMQSTAQPLMDKMHELTSAKQTLDALQTDRSIHHEQRRSVQESVLRRGGSGYVVATGTQINALLSAHQFRADTATPEQKQQILQELANRESLMNTELRDSFTDVDQASLEKRIAVISGQFQNAKDYVSGKKTKELYDTANGIAMSAAKHKLLEYPNMASYLNELETFKGLDSGLLQMDQKLQFGTEVVMPTLKGLLTTIHNPSSNPYEDLKATADKSHQVDFMKNLVGVLHQNIADPKNRTSVRNALEAWTNEMSTSPDTIPTQVYQSVMDLASDPNWLKMSKGGVNLNANLVSGLKEYNARLEQKMSHDMTQSLGRRIPLKSKQSPEMVNFGNNYLGDQFVGKMNDYPRLIDLLDMHVGHDATVSFTPLPEVASDPAVRRAARDLSRKFGTEVGKTVRAYAHTVNGNTNYKQAFQDVVGGSAFKELRQLPQESYTPAQPAATGTVNRTEGSPASSAEEIRSKIADLQKSLAEAEKQQGGSPGKQ